MNYDQLLEETIQELYEMQEYIEAKGWYLADRDRWKKHFSACTADCSLEDAYRWEKLNEPVGIHLVN